ncbi:DNA repair protein RecN [Clostridium sp. D2Q-11]|uniref:DNA repair protein RecN n=1 Tax=Anaeromonas frigoriresistens TaxID=2683708 RepID=A0A942Z8N4_9FIRM|nr:DNA repair protein RecN [Anaeromonas frigoriresistens]MBS4539977.1 DNA repair protein RecN [Anaeromonas frigoriresistens]
MLLELNIKNFAIIDDLNISFTKGFNVLTGETGAGKSIIIDAVSMILGERSNKDFIKTGKDKAIIEALFHLDNPRNINSILKEYGIDCEPDNTLLISREIHLNGRSFSRVNGHTITLTMLKQLTHYLVDIHGQHEHQSLLSSENHIELIDSLGGKDLNSYKDEIYNKYLELNDLKKRLSSIVIDEMERERKIDLLKFQVDEINTAELKSNEEDMLMNEYSKLSNQEEISKILNQSYNALDYNDYNDISIIDRLNVISHDLNKISKFDDTLNNYYDNINDIIYQMQDFARDIRSYSENIEYDPERLEFLDGRIELINKLKRKYGSNISEVLNYRDDITEELDKIINDEKEINELHKKIENKEMELLKLSKNLSKIRKNIIDKFEKDIINELYELNMKNVNFKVNHEILLSPNIKGIDKIEFLISTNLGEPLRKLSKIVSGGEMSRIMLAIKSITAETDNISTMIFDEIDTGISGRTAQIVGEKITNISRNHQVLCITHLPQIAAMADSHFLILKNTKINETRTHVRNLGYEDRIDELSRLLGGVDLTSTTRLHAKEMIELSKKLK